MTKPTLEQTQAAIEDLKAEGMIVITGEFNSRGEAVFRLADRATQQFAEDLSSYLYGEDWNCLSSYRRKRRMDVATKLIARYEKAKKPT